MGSHREIPVRCLLLTVLVCLVLVVEGCDGVDRVADRTGHGIPAPAIRGPLIAVLGTSPPRVLFFDAATMKQKGSVDLRSECIDIAEYGRTLITAQCGRPGEGSDTVVGLVDLERGRLDYAETGHLDPERVVASDGVAYSINGEMLRHGIAGSRVDLDSGETIGLVLPHGTVASTSLGGMLWVAERVPGAEANSDDRLWRIDASGEATLVADVPTVIALDARGSSVWALVESPASQSGLELIGFEASSGSAQTRIAVQADGFQACSFVVLTDGGFALTDYTGVDLAEAHGEVLILGSDGRERARAELRGPGALAASPDGVVVLCQPTGELVVLDATTGRPREERRVSEAPGDLVDCVYIDDVEQ